MKEGFVGFDSAWGGRNPGAIAYAIFQRGTLEGEELPQLASFLQASAIINYLQRECDDVLVAIDQPTIVPNQRGSRPVDGVTAALISRLRSGVQPANRNKVAMFGNKAPIWQFVSNIGFPGYSGTEDDGTHNPLVDFEAAKTAIAGQTHLIEVYPALALPALEGGFMCRRSAAKYNPANRRKFTLADWRCVCETVRRCAHENGFLQLSQWADGMVKLKEPKKPDQDKIDAAICLLIALWWRRARARYGLSVIGDRANGYMVTPTSHETREIFQAAARRRGVPIDTTP